ncbi:hypothetical protein KFK09_012894 [Dendrobium nobile]|uniref:Uncharacterized protein n=1 Tax=Dendrobium nobile TaxID=94219 RepID=A0A8T3BGT7_DENNO|nr:hypothetical protein KFK09_012894 [Dendrobium nobile]
MDPKVSFLFIIVCSYIKLAKPYKVLFKSYPGLANINTSISIYPYFNLTSQKSAWSALKPSICSQYDSTYTRNYQNDALGHLVLLSQWKYPS